MKSLAAEEPLSTMEDELPKDENVNPISKKRQRNTEDFSEDSDCETTVSAYEQIRIKNIREREKLMSDLGIDSAIEELKSVTPQRTASKTASKTSSKRIKREKEVLPKREPSRRLRNLNAKALTAIENEVKDELEKEEEEEQKDERILGTKPMEIENQESEDLLKRLAEIKNETGILSHEALCDTDVLQRKLSLYTLTKEERVLAKRIQSLEIHPSIEKKLVIAGSMKGNVGLWDLDSGVVLPFYPHRAAVNCISVSNFDHSKVFSTSHDGSLLCWDLEMTLFSNVYATDLSDWVRHLTWHDQMDANTLLLSHGNGSVGLVDLRNKRMVDCWYPCFDRSARTVQHHPTNNNYFLVSSGAGCSCNVYDLRGCSKTRAEPVSEMSHSKGLTSSFFSPSGEQVLTTCNDDFIRVYSSPLANPSLRKAIPHNNFTGRWLSVFKAKWYPERDDAFFVGSLLNPRRIQIYGVNGKLINELMDPEVMSTITPVIAAHPTLPFIAGGNSSGRVYVFSDK